LDGLRHQLAVVEQLETVYRDDAEGLFRQVERRALLRNQIEAVANRVRPRVHDLPCTQVGRCPSARRVVNAAESRRDLAVELLRERMTQVVAPEAALDMRDRRAERAADHAAE